MQRGEQSAGPPLEIGLEPRNTSFACFWIYRIAKAFHFPPESNPNIDKNRSTSSVGGFREIDAPTEIRTPVLALKGLRPGPLDDGGR